MSLSTDPSMAANSTVATLRVGSLDSVLPGVHLGLVLQDVLCFRTLSKMETIAVPLS